jgi:hypothetical protein
MLLTHTLLAAAANGPSSSSLRRHALYGRTVNSRAFRIAVLFQINSSLIA